MFFYRFEDKLLFSKDKYEFLKAAEEGELKESEGIVYFLIHSPPLKSRRCYSLSDPSLLFLREEGINLLQAQESKSITLQDWIIEKIQNRSIRVVNTGYPDWKEALNIFESPKWRVNVIGLGDVGGTLVTGLRLLGGDCISRIGIYDLDENKSRRWEYEASQILDYNKIQCYPEIISLKDDDLFNCDMFIFCVSVGVPKIGEESRDVRMVQFEGNSKIVNIYAKAARKNGFKGIFAVVSDPVDLLCKSALISSNTNSMGEMDFLGLAPEQIRGYGLGVMNARAAYYAKQNERAPQYLKEGRVFGPHGEGLVVADSIQNYNNELSSQLTELVKRANLKIRGTGYKPFVAPAFSSGAISLINTIKGEWHYSASFMGGVFMGAKNRLLKSGIEIERNDLDERLLKKLKKTYDGLGMIL